MRKLNKYQMVSGISGICGLNSGTYTLQKQVLQSEVSPSVTIFSYIYSIHAYLYKIPVSNKHFMVNCENL